MIKGSFPMSKVLVFEGNSYVCWKNEDIRLFYDCTCMSNGKATYVEKIKAHGKKCFSYVKSFSFRG